MKTNEHDTVYEKHKQQVTGFINGLDQRLLAVRVGYMLGMLGLGIALGAFIVGQQLVHTLCAGSFGGIVIIDPCVNQVHSVTRDAAYFSATLGFLLAAQAAYFDTKQP